MQDASEHHAHSDVARCRCNCETKMHLDFQYRLGLLTADLYIEFRFGSVDQSSGMDNVRCLFQTAHELLDTSRYFGLDKMNIKFQLRSKIGQVCKT